MDRRKQERLIGYLGWFVVIWGIVFLAVIGTSHYLIANGHDRVAGVPVFDVRDFTLLAMLGSPCVIALFLYEILRWKAK